jgi:hypothetical protein
MGKWHFSHTTSMHACEMKTQCFSEEKLGAMNVFSTDTGTFSAQQSNGCKGD